MIVFGSVWARFGVPKWAPKSVPKVCGATPGGVLGQPWGRLDMLLGSTCGLGSFLRPLRPFLGPFLASSGAIFAILGASFWFVGAVFLPVVFFCVARTFFDK